MILLLIAATFGAGLCWLVPANILVPIWFSLLILSLAPHTVPGAFRERKMKFSEALASLVNDGCLVGIIVGAVGRGLGTLLLGA